MKGDADQALEYTQPALDNSLEEDWASRTHLLNIKGFTLQYQGDLPAAPQSFTAAVAALVLILVDRMWKKLSSEHRAVYQA